MEQDLGLIGGNIFHGEISLDQVFHMRPAPGYADFRTPIRGLYNASSGTHGGGGVNGIPGLQAFRQAKRDGLIRRGA
jgi:phytoene dehydrogenase-like protein